MKEIRAIICIGAIVFSGYTFYKYGLQPLKYFAGGILVSGAFFAMK